MYSDDICALKAVANRKATLCTLVGIEGSYSRRLGAHLSIDADGSHYGTLADGCLEQMLAGEARRAEAAGKRSLIRVGSGSPVVDFRLPCGSGLDILIDPLVEPGLCASVCQTLLDRRSVEMPLPIIDERQKLTHVRYIPDPRLIVLGTDPEVRALKSLATDLNLEAESHTPMVSGRVGGLSLGKPPRGIRADAYSAIVLLFHDHEWERSIIPWALESDAFYVGSQGGHQVRKDRETMLRDIGFTPARIKRIHSPVGLIPRAKDPRTLAISIMSEVVLEHERLRKHA